MFRNVNLTNIFVSMNALSSRLYWSLFFGLQLHRFSIFRDELLLSQSKRKRANFDKSDADRYAVQLQMMFS